MGVGGVRHYDVAHTRLAGSTPCKFWEILLEHIAHIIERGFMKHAGFSSESVYVVFLVSENAGKLS